jgi:hypothetical protein
MKQYYIFIYYLAWNSYGEPFYAQLIITDAKLQAFDVDLGIVGVLNIS